MKPSKKKGTAIALQAHLVRTVESRKRDAAKARMITTRDLKRAK